MLGELYCIDEVMLQKIDELEDYFGSGDARNLYEREQAEVYVNQGKYRAWTYFYLKSNGGDSIIPSGDWRRR
nr:gamma-glutamylcyclotransferase family protein [Paenibacillus sp. HB172176]